MKRPFYVDHLREGMILAEAIKDPRSGALLMAAEQTITAKVIDSLKRRGIEQVSIEMSEKDMRMFELDNDVLPTIDIALANAARQSITPIRTSRGKVFVKVQDVIDNAEMIKSRILVKTPYDSDKLSYRLTDYRVKNENGTISRENLNIEQKRIIESASNKSVRVATFATVLANAYNVQAAASEKIDLNILATAALLHNYGCACSDDELRKKLYLPKLGTSYQAITEEKIKELNETYDPKFNSYYSFVLLSENEIIKSKSVLKAMILNSNENRQGTGPLKSKQLMRDSSPYIMGSLIISLCSLYDQALVENIKGKTTLENVSAVLYEIKRKQLYDDKLIDLLVENIPLYPVGTKVKLAGKTSSKYAIVIENYATLNSYHRPKVLTIPENEELDLRNEVNITIDAVVGSEVQYSKLYTEQAQKTDITRGSKLGRI